MNSSMETTVTARMAQGKKDAANQAFKALGTNASQAINQLFSYAIAHKALPFKEENKAITATDLEEALSWVDSLGITERTRFDHMSDKEIRAERRAARAQQGKL